MINNNSFKQEKPTHIIESVTCEECNKTWNRKGNRSFYYQACLHAVTTYHKLTAKIEPVPENWSPIQEYLDSIDDNYQTINYSFNRG